MPTAEQPRNLCGSTRLEACLRAPCRRGRLPEYDPEHGVETYQALSLPLLSEESFRKSEYRNASPATTPANRRRRPPERSVEEKQNNHRSEGKCRSHKPLRYRRSWWVLRRASDYG